MRITYHRHNIEPYAYSIHINGKPLKIMKGEYEVVLSPFDTAYTSSTDEISSPYILIAIKFDKHNLFTTDRVRLFDEIVTVEGWKLIIRKKLREMINDITSS